jgi:hypothetical protein
MIREGQPLIIDMGEFSVGSFLFDLGQWCTIYGYPELNTCEIVTQIPSDQGRVFLENLLDAYFTDRSQEERAIFEANRHFSSSSNPLQTSSTPCPTDRHDPAELSDTAVNQSPFLNSDKQASDSRNSPNRLWPTQTSGSKKITHDRSCWSKTARNQKKPHRFGGAFFS